MKTDGQKENIVVGSVAYTGWKLIGVVPESVQETSINKFRYYIITTILILVMMLLQVNRFISRKISRPIRELDESVKAYERLFNSKQKDEKVSWMHFRVRLTHIFSITHWNQSPG